jgi:hypothetical protein
MLTPRSKGLSRFGSTSIDNSPVFQIATVGISVKQLGVRFKTLHDNIVELAETWS